jgi:5'-3' exonuclease|tara:strand:+ start:438 stop:1295 length:858 start_codon:yes stop_codon:yes gene_type:complete
MILLDYSQIALANIIVQKLNDENMIRHMILNSIRMYNKRYRKEYGQMVICVDGSGYWRKDYFPEYKGMRKKNRDEQSTVDWGEIFRILNLVREELKEHFPYKVIHLDGCEADDVIGALTINTQEFGQHEPVMILSSDKDFIQLHKYNNVKQFSPSQKKMVVDKNPRTYKFEHICRGDKGDGIPNILSPDNAIMDNIRQSPVTKKKLELWTDNAEDLTKVMSQEEYRNFQRNKTLIDLDDIPKVHHENIINTYVTQKLPMKMKVLNYLIKKRCNLLIECVEEFYNA